MNDQIPAPTSPPSQGSGTGCFARGCLIAIVGLIACAMLLLVGGTILYRQALTHFTAAQTVEVAAVPTTPAQYQSARGNLDRLRDALSAKREETVRFTAADLNALVAHEQEFSGARGHVRFAIADSNMTVDLSVPISSTPLPGLNHRWFNGTARFTFVYDDEQFDFAPLSVQAGNWSVPEWLFTSDFNASFSRSFARRFREAMEKNRQGSEAWRQIKSIKLEGDKLVVTTRTDGR